MKKTSCILIIVSIIISIISMIYTYTNTINGEILLSEIKYKMSNDTMDLVYLCDILISVDDNEKIIRYYNDLFESADKEEAISAYIKNEKNISQTSESLNNAFWVQYVLAHIRIGQTEELYNGIDKISSYYIFNSVTDLQTTYLFLINDNAMISDSELIEFAELFDVWAEKETGKKQRYLYCYEMNIYSKLGYDTESNNAKTKAENVNIDG